MIFKEQLVDSDIYEEKHPNRDWRAAFRQGWRLESEISPSNHPDRFQGRETIPKKPFTFLPSMIAALWLWFWHCKGAATLAPTLEPAKPNKRNQHHSKTNLKPHTTFHYQRTLALCFSFHKDFTRWSPTRKTRHVYRSVEEHGGTALPSAVARTTETRVEGYRYSAKHTLVLWQCERLRSGTRCVPCFLRPLD